MTELLIARADSVVRGADGALYRLSRGRTIAEAGHPAVVKAPQAFVPFEIHLPAPEGASSSTPAPEPDADLAAERELSASYLAQLVAVRDVLEQRDLLPSVEAQQVEGWLAGAVEAAIEGRKAPEPDSAPAEDVVAPPRARPRRTPKPRPAGDDA